jgi:SpoVK/Ycf46/Vps4 family AAA+-type ATPase
MMTTPRKMETATLLQLPLGEDSSLVEHVKELRPLTDLILPEEPRGALDRVMAENYAAAALMGRGLRPANRILFRGPPGCGKTVAAGGLALALGIPFAVTRLDGIITGYMGSTAKQLRKVFDFARNQAPMVLFLDEIDALGRTRDDRSSHDVTEMKRVTNSLLVMLEEFAVQAGPSPSLVIAATNHEAILDPALERRFDKIVTFPRPTGVQAAALLKRLVERHDTRTVTKLSPPGWKAWPRWLAGMSFADVERLALDAVKSTVMDETLSIERALLMAMGDQKGRAAAGAGRKR